MKPRSARGRVHVRAHFRCDLAWDGVGRSGPVSVDDVGGAVKLPWMDRALCGRVRCVGQRRGERPRSGVAVVSARCRGRQNGGGSLRAVDEGLELRWVEEGGRGHGVGSGSGGGVVREWQCHGRGQEVVVGRGGGWGRAWLGPRCYLVCVTGAKAREAGRVV